MTTTKKKPASARARAKGLKLKKETLKDLDARGRAKNVKGGVIIELGVSHPPLACVSALVCPDPPSRKTKK